MKTRRWAHHVKVSVFCKPEDDPALVREGLLRLFPFSLEEQKLRVEESKATGFSEREIRILEVFMKKESQTQAFLRNLMRSLSREQRELLLRSLDERMDDGFHVSIDLDKNRLQFGQFWLVDSGPCYHIRVRAAAFPSTRGAALKILEEMVRYEDRN